MTTLTAQKYGAKRTEVDGHSFPSRAEARRYGELKLMQQQGVIEGLELQPRFPLLVNGVNIGTYVADFRYRDIERGGVVIEDTKGMRTPMYKWKKKHLHAQYGIDILET